MVLQKRKQGQGCLRDGVPNGARLLVLSFHVQGTGVGKRCFVMLNGRLRGHSYLKRV